MLVCQSFQYSYRVEDSVAIVGAYSRSRESVGMISALMRLSLYHFVCLYGARINQNYSLRTIF